MTCAVKHPEYPDVGCALTTANHIHHVAFRTVVGPQGGLVVQRAVWPNEEYVSRAQQSEQSRNARAKVSQLAQEVRAAQPGPTTKPLRLKSAQARVAAYFLEHVGEWVPGRKLMDPNAADGGAAGLRRMRALRTEYHWDIEERPDPDPDTFLHQYRLVQRPGDAEFVE